MPKNKITLDVDEFIKEIESWEVDNELVEISEETLEEYLRRMDKVQQKK